MWSLLLLAIPLYLVVGLAAARIIHKNKMDRWLSLPPEQRNAKRLMEVEIELDNMTHSVCSLEYSSMESQGCDCHERIEWNRLTKERKSIEVGGSCGPTVDMKPVLTWPYAVAVAFVASGHKPKEIISEDFVEVPKEEVEHPLWTGYRDEQWQELNRKWDELLEMSHEDEILAKPLGECTPDEILSVLPKTTKPRLEQLSKDDLMTVVKTFSGETVGIYHGLE